MSLNRPGISGVLFDIGGVLVALDGVPYLARTLQLEESREAIHQRWLACPSVIAHETGRITAEEFAAAVVSELKLPIAAESFLSEFAAWLQRPYAGAYELVERIPRRYRVAALSNMSQFHWTRIAAMGWPTRFDAVYLSCVIGQLKPLPETFRVALYGMQLPASAVLFLDDGPANVAAARAQGMEAQVVSGPEEVREVLERYGVL